MKKITFENGHFLLKRRSLLLLMVFAVAAVATPMPTTLLQSSSQDAGLILEKKEDFNPPVKITRTASKIGIIEPGKKIAANKDWFKGLTLAVCNRSTQVVTHIEAHIRFPRPVNYAL